MTSSSFNPRRVNTAARDFFPCFGHDKGEPVGYNLTFTGVFAKRKGVSMTVREAIRLIEADGWYLVATRGSHRQFKHPTKPGRVTIAGKPSDDLAPGTRNSIFKQAGLKEKR